ncbi:LOW QUALITY PROTEIN: hypothetical protein FOPG_04538 [Fusarium oxysporum f. sp. conglutinans race 2 54008]|uniref:Uncharacterized protein n=1 Tax=Fusarium oxysporum f. sp. conglutinans race 2 54008 TaxID=1089457 RepID=X0I1V5_FUSOX|nr:LOW QUALITY PROTEIN: hypothetical protein FOPG_04538 [Fusarium oxysporum f. sp. conglutinans race 2 54008]
MIQLKARNMKLTLATLTLVALTAATPPPEPVVHKPVPEKASSGCYHYYVLPTPFQTQPISHLYLGLNLKPQPNINVNPLTTST